MYIIVVKARAIRSGDSCLYTYACKRVYIMEYLAFWEP